MRQFFNYVLYAAGLITVAGLMLQETGYLYPAPDQIELLPYALKMSHPDWYSKDFFLQYVSTHEPNFRSAFAWFIHLLGDEPGNAIKVLFVINLLLLLAGTERLASRFIKWAPLRWLAVYLGLWGLHHWHIGYQDIYYNYLISSGVAEMLMAWSLYHFFGKHYRTCFALAGVAGLTHASVCLSILLPMALWLVWEYKLEWRRYMAPVLCFLIFGGCYMLWVIIASSHGSSDPDYFRTYFMERNHHHYFINATETRLIIIHVSLVFASMLISFFRNKNLFRFQLISVLLIFGYYLGIEHLHSSSIASMQLYILDSWMVVLALCIFLSLIDADVFSLAGRSISSALIPVTIILTMLPFAMLFPVGCVFENLKRSRDEQNFPDAIYEQWDIETAKFYHYIHVRTDKNACFVYPASLTEFKQLSHRSTFVDYKAVIPDAAWMKAWSQRVRLVYGTSDAKLLSNNEALYAMDKHLQKLSKGDFEHLHELGVTHILCYEEITLPLTLDTTIKGYHIYQLP